MLIFTFGMRGHVRVGDGLEVGLAGLAGRDVPPVDGDRLGGLRTALVDGAATDGAADAAALGAVLAPPPNGGRWQAPRSANRRATTHGQHRPWITIVSPSRDDTTERPPSRSTD